MGPEMLSVVVGALATIVGGVLGGFASRSEMWDRFFSRSQFPRLTGTRWEASWIHDRKGAARPEKEIFEFTGQKHGRVFGKISMPTRSDMLWDFEGDYNDRFLRLFWHPSSSSVNKFFLDYGCYFFERQGDGTFKGYSVGYDAETNRVEADEHELKAVGPAR